MDALASRWLRHGAALALLALAHLAALAQIPDPRPDWLSADSAHFRVHYRASQRAQAEAVVRAAERVYPRVTQSLQWEPRGRTEIVLYSEFDLANGFSTPLPFNMIGILLTPPDEGELLDNSGWLDLLLVHEFTHTVHLDKVRGAPGVLQRIFGRVVWFIPNLFQPGWPLEGLATLHESDPATGRGRLRGPLFEAFLRAERGRGFLKLAELNADGRALPLAKQYLYGAYFFDFIERRYGRDKIYAIVEQYSGNIVPRLHTAPWGATGKTMDALWDEFLADLDQQVRERAAPIEAVAERTGTRLLGPLFELPSLAALPDGGVLAVVDDGLNAPQLERIGRDGRREPVTRVRRGARVEVGADGRVLVAQPDLCDTYYLSYDLYRLDGSRLVALTRCAHLRRAVHVGEGLVAVQVLEGRTRLVRLSAQGEDLEPLYTPPEGVELIDLAAAADGRHVSVVTRREGDWRVLEIAVGAATGAPRELLRHGAPIYNLRQGRAGLEAVSARDGQLNVWRIAGGAMQRLTHAHTAVVAHGGSAGDGSLTVVVVAAQGYELRRLDSAQPLQTAAPMPVPALAADAATPSPLGEARPYAAWRSMYPRSWLPSIVSDRGLTAYGASTYGADATGWHQYIAYAMWETSQKELLGGLEYIFRGSHGLALDRSLTAREWTGPSDDERITVYDRRLQLQWLSLLPVPGLDRLERRVRVGLGAALDRLERVTVATDSRSRLRDERLVALLADIDLRGSNWYADGANRGFKLSGLVESHKPFSPDNSDAAPDLDGTVARADAKVFLGIGRGVLALRYTEARARDRTEPFQLGGAAEGSRAIGFALNDRELPLRGYRGSEPELLGRHARLASLEWRMPLADIDRHGMVPPFGVNRLAGTAFFDIGRAWDGAGSNPGYRRGVGVELRAETRLLYALALDLRLGVAHALDPVPGGSRTRGYLTIGQGF